MNDMTAVTFHTGDCREVLKTLPDESVNCCVTSPPYYGLRDYGVAGQIGLEHSPEEFIQNMTGVFKEVRRVLRDDGTLWLNMGDSYSSGGRGGNPTEETSGLQGGQSTQRASMVSRRGKQGKTGQRADRRHTAQIAAFKPSDLPPKNLMGMPWRLAFALQADGWILRQDIIWHKPNPMPESVRDRCTKAHEYLFLLSKSERYHYDFDAMQEPRVGGDKDAGVSGLVTGSEPHTAIAHNRQKGDAKTFRDGQYVSGNKFNNSHATARESTGNKHAPKDTRNRRSVWTIATQAFAGEHFATFPTALVEPCILAGCPEGGVVLDPFGGAGTVGLVADRLQRKAILIELNPQYLEMARRRITDDAPLFNSIGR